MSKLTKALDGAIERSRRRTTLYGWMGKRLPSGEYTFVVDGRPEAVWVTLRLSAGAQTTVPAVNAPGLPHSPKLAIEIRKEDEEYIITRRSGKKALSAPQPTDPSGTPPHIHSHTGLGNLDQDTHPQYVNINGLRALTGDWDIGEDMAIAAELIRARDSEGLSLRDSSGNLGLKVENGGIVRTTLDLIAGDGTGVSNLRMDGGTASAKTLSWRSAGLNRFLLQVTNTETGSDAGSDFAFLVRHDDSTPFRSPIVIRRATGALGVGGFQHGLLPTHTLDVSQIHNAGNALRVLRNLAAASTDSPLVEFIEDHASDDQGLLRLQQDGTGYIVEAYDGATLVWKLNDGGRVDIAQIIQALTSAGLSFRDDGGNQAINIADGGAVDIPVSLTVKPGTASDTAKVGGILLSSTTQTGNVGTGEDVLLDYSLPANTLAVNNQSIRVKAFGTIANNANNKRLRFRFGTAGTNLVLDTTAAYANNAYNWLMEAEIYRTGAATQIGYAKVTVSDPSVLSSSEQMGTSFALDQTLSGAVTIRISGEATANNDIVIRGCKIWWDGENT